MRETNLKSSLFSRLNTILSFDDDEEFRHKLVLFFSIHTILITGVFSVILKLRIGSVPEVAIYIGALMGVVCLILVKTNHANLAAYILIAFSWLTLIVQLLQFAGIRSFVFAAFSLIVLLSKLILPKINLGLMFGCVVATAVFVYAVEKLEIITPVNPDFTDPIVALLAQLAIATLSAGVFLLASKRFQIALDRSSAHLAELQENRQLLEKRSAELETSHAALLVNEARYKLLINTSPDAILILNAATGAILEFSTMATEMFGYSDSELLSQTLFDIVRDANGRSIEPSSLLNRWQLLGEEDVLTIKANYQSHENGLDPVEIRLRRLPSSDENLVHATITDIRERLVLEQQQYQSQKLENLGVLAGGIAHDFNNLLVAMLSQTSIARYRLEPDHPAYKHIDKAVGAAERAKTLTAQMLAYSGQGRFEIRPIQINDLIQENLTLLRSTISKKVELTTTFQENLPQIEGDAAQMQQVVMNLIINAAQSHDDKVGKVWVRTAVKKLTRSDNAFSQFTGEPLAEGNYVMIFVGDNGKGMDEATLERIFDPFFTTKKAGTGLGLAATLGIVRSHRGGLIVGSQKGVGTVFELAFPIIDDLAATRDPLHTDQLFRKDMLNTG